MKYSHELRNTAGKLESRAKELRAAAGILDKLKSPRNKTKTHRSRVSPKALVDVLMGNKKMRIREIHEHLGVSKPTIYAWIKKTGLFVNNGGSVSINPSRGDTQH